MLEWHDISYAWFPFAICKVNNALFTELLVWGIAMDWMSRIWTLTNCYGSPANAFHISFGRIIMCIKDSQLDLLKFNFRFCQSVEGQLLVTGKRALWNKTNGKPKFVCVFTEWGEFQRQVKINSIIQINCTYGHWMSRNAMYLKRRKYLLHQLLFQVLITNTLTQPPETTVVSNNSETDSGKSCIFLWKLVISEICKIICINFYFY